jgi:K+-transporting ATPase ATPase A chain
MGKKVEAFEMKMAAIAILVAPVITLMGTALAVLLDAGKAGISNPGAHGLSEILYAYTSASFNNGSAFAGISANTPFYNYTLGACILAGRYLGAVPVLAIAGSLVRKKIVPKSSGTLPTHKPLFNTFLICVILIVALLNFIPVLALGPVVEHLMMGK